MSISSHLYKPVLCDSGDSDSLSDGSTQGEPSSGENGSGENGSGEQSSSQQGSAEANNDTTNNRAGNTFIGPNDDPDHCEHRSRNRNPVSDCEDFEASPVPCHYCDRNALDGTEGQSAIYCSGCGAMICENCNAPNDDSEEDSAVGDLD